MNPTNREMKAEMISEIIDGLSESQKITFLTLYFDEYTWQGLKQLLGLMSVDYNELGVIIDMETILKEK